MLFIYTYQFMEQQEEIFQITVQINKGLEPTTFSVMAEDNSDITAPHELVFKVSREKDNEILAVFTPDANHQWQQLKGNFDQNEVDPIGAPIDAYYA